MAAVRGLRVSVKAEAPAGPDLGLPSPEAESGVDRGEPEPMEVEEGELEIVPVRRSLKELIPVRAGVGGQGGGRGASAQRRRGPEGAVAGAPAGEVWGAGEKGASVLGTRAPGWRRDAEREKGRRCAGNGC